MVPLTMAFFLLEMQKERGLNHRCMSTFYPGYDKIKRKVYRWSLCPDKGQAGPEGTVAVWGKLMIIGKDHSKKSIAKDIAAGLIIMLVSIPISMGYAAVAGMPVVYGLYGSVFPILLFGLLSTSPRFVFGVDAAPAALVGSMLGGLGIAAGSGEAVRVVPVITLLVSLWLFLFYLLRADKLLRFISQPVMGGFITGIGMTVILMQVPKLFGQDAGRGELPELIRHIIESAEKGFDLLSFGLGVGTVLIICLCRKWIPKVPMSVVMMFLGLILSRVFHLEEHGVKMLPEVAAGLPPFAFPDITIFSDYGIQMVLPSFTIALVILAETLLATNNLALKHEDKIDNRREILAYAVGNSASALTGSIPINGSVSRSGIADQFGVHSQIMSLVAGISMIGVLLFGTGMIRYLPVPILTAIVISALIGTFEFGLARKLGKVDKAECFIFFAAFATVLLFGTIYGVLIGTILSAVTFILRASEPGRTYLGFVEADDIDGFYSFTEITSVRPIQGTLIYRFTGQLFYANIGILEKDIESGLREDTRVVIIDAGGIGSVDLTAAERLLHLYDRLKKKGIRLYLVGQVAEVNTMLRTFGARRLIDEGAVKRRISRALSDAGIEKPYPLDERERAGQGFVKKYAEYRWAYGDEAEDMLRSIAKQLARKYLQEETYDFEQMRREARELTHGHLDIVDEDELLDMLEMQFAVMGQPERTGEDVENRIIERHIYLEEKMTGKGEEPLGRIVRHRRRRDERFKKKHPEAYRVVQDERAHLMELLEKRNPELARRLKEEKE